MLPVCYTVRCRLYLLWEPPPLDCVQPLCLRAPLFWFIWVSFAAGPPGAQVGFLHEHEVNVSKPHAAGKAGSQSAMGLASPGGWGDHQQRGHKVFGATQYGEVPFLTCFLVLLLRYRRPHVLSSLLGPALFLRL